MDSDVRGACCGAMSTTIAGVGNADFSCGKAVCNPEEGAIGAPVGAESFIPQYDHDEETAYCKRKGTYPEVWKGRPEVFGGKVINDGWEGLSLGDAYDLGIDKHIKRCEEGNKYKESGTEGFWFQSNFFHQPSTQVLISDQVACPSAEDASEDKGSEDEEHKEDESCIEPSKFKGLHGFAGLHGGEGFARYFPVYDVEGDEKMYDDEGKSSPFCSF